MYDFTYQRAARADDAAAKIGGADDGAYIAGGQTLRHLLMVTALTRYRLRQRFSPPLSSYSIQLINSNTSLLRAGLIHRFSVWQTTIVRFLQRFNRWKSLRQSSN